MPFEFDYYPTYVAPGVIVFGLNGELSFPWPRNVGRVAIVPEGVPPVAGVGFAEGDLAYLHVSAIIDSDPAPNPVDADQVALGQYFSGWAIPGTYQIYRVTSTIDRVLPSDYVFTVTANRNPEDPFAAFQ